MHCLLNNCFIWMFIIVTCSATLNVFDQCDDDGDSCPVGSRCRWRGCDGRRCVCDSYLLPTLNKTSCVKETPLGETCRQDSVCVGQPLSECQLNTICGCLEGYKPSSDGSSCVLVMKGDDIAAEYGQFCDNKKFWCFPDDLVCSKQKCACKPGFRPALKEERYAEPYNTRHCRPETFKLDKPVNISGEECQKPVTLTTTQRSTSVDRRSTGPPTLPTSFPSSASILTSSTTLSSSPSLSPSTQSNTPMTSAPTKTSASSTTEKKTPSPSTAKPTSTLLTTSPSIASSTTQSTRISSTSTMKSTSKSTTIIPTEPAMTSNKTTTSSTSSKTNPSIEISTPMAITTPQGLSTSEKSVSASNGLSSSVPTIPNTSSPSSKITISTTQRTPTSEKVTRTSTMSSSVSTSETKSASASTESPIRSSTIVSTSTKEVKKSSTAASTTAAIKSTKPTAVVTDSTTVHPPAPSSSAKVSISSASLTTVSSVTVVVGDKCKDKKCPVNSECVTDACNVERCRCELGYADSPDGKSCWKLSTLGEECSGERICQGHKTQCGDRGVCECEDGYERSDSGRWCRLKTSWFIDFPMVGEECSGGFFSQCYMQFEQHCVNGRCECKDGLRAISDRQDLDAVYPDITQCRNHTFAVGAREEMLCFAQSRESRDYDMYERAKSKIHRIQGGIIGGCVGFVALLGIVIGVVALVRWKRRGRREQIRDSSSTASTDATSRYSFKIPRPFTHFVGAKEYDSTQISYPNTVFDKEDDTVQIDHEPEDHSEPKPDVVNVGTLARQTRNTQDNS